MMPLARAARIAEKVATELSPYCEQIEIAGSIRRQRPECRDIDIVCEAHDPAGLLRRVRERCKLRKQGEQYILAEMRDGTSLDLWLAHVPEASGGGELFPTSNPFAKPRNWGSLLLCRTGSIAHNIHLVGAAKRLGCAWNPHWGVYDAGVCIASETEEAIFEALKVPFVPPEKRERFP